jgi:hypothetical protein
METAVSAPSPVDAAGSGRSNGVYGPPFPLTSSTCTCVLSAGAGTPRDFMAPDTCDGTATAGSGTLKPDIGPATSMRPGHVSPRLLPYYEVLLVLSFTCVVLLVLSGPGCCLALLLRLVERFPSALQWIYPHTYFKLKSAEHPRDASVQGTTSALYDTSHRPICMLVISG